MSRTTTACMLVIGNELLSGKFEERNVYVLSRELFALGIRLRRVVICPDDVGVIAEDLADLSARHDHVFTSGGVGPTHDDVTMEGVARAFSVPLERSAKLGELLGEYFADRLTDDHLVMADIPRGAELLFTEGVRWPLLKMRNVFVLPGVPEVFRLKMTLLRAHLNPGEPLISKQIELQRDEGSIASVLNRLVVRFPEVAIGSYPRWGGDDGPRLIVSFDGTDAAAVDSAAKALLDAVAEESPKP